MTEIECNQELAMIQYGLDLLELARLPTLRSRVRTLGILVARFERAMEVWRRLKGEGKDGT